MVPLVSSLRCFVRCVFFLSALEGNFLSFICLVMLLYYKAGGKPIREGESGLLLNVALL
jgi:hypothetical protein